MSEKKQDLKSVDDITAEQYGESTFEVDARARLYEYSYPYVNIWERMALDLHLEGTESILDVGCGRGEWLRRLAEAGHQGLLMGVNNTPIFEGTEMALHHEGIRNVGFHVSDARELRIFTEEEDTPEGEGQRIPNDYFDIVSAQFLLYHVGEPLKALEEFHRVLKPGGKLLISTRGVFNQMRLWEFEKRIAAELQAMWERGEASSGERREGGVIPGYNGITAPESFYSQFDLAQARQILGQKYDIEREFIQQSPEYELRIPGTEEGYMEYRYALQTLQKSFDPKPQGGDFVKAADAVVRPVFDKEVERHGGYFPETVEQGFFICRKR